MGILNLSQHDWDAMHAGVARSTLHVSRTIALLGERPTSELQEAILKTHTSMTLGRWGAGRTGQGETSYQKAWIDRLGEVMNAATEVLRELAATVSTKS